MVKKRLNIQLASGIDEYVKSKSEEMGLSQSAFITMCIAMFKQGQDVMQIMEHEKRKNCAKK